MATETETKETPAVKPQEGTAQPRHLHEVPPSPNGNGTPTEKDPFPDLNKRDTYWMATAEWIEVHEPKSILAPGEQPQPTQLVPRKENFFINIHPAAFYLQNRGKFPMFVVTNSLVITKKIYEQARFVQNAMDNAVRAEMNAALPPEEKPEGDQEAGTSEKPDIKLVTE